MASFLPRRRKILLTATAGSLLGMPLVARTADPYPSRPVKIILSLPAGSGSDVIARYVAKRLQELAGQPFIVENRPGGNGFIAAEALLRSAADGYTLTIASNSLMAANVALFKKLPYDPVTDFTPVGRIVRAPNAVFVAANSPYKTLNELVAAGRAKGDALRYAYPTASANIATHAFLDIAQVQALGVPYQGPPPALVDVASGIVDFIITDVSAARPLLGAGRLRLLAVTTATRLREYPNVPTVAQTGIGEFQYVAWAGMFAPAKTPAAVVERLAGWLRHIALESDTQSFLAAMRNEAAWADAEVLRAFQLREIDWWKRMAANAGIKPQ